MRKFLVIFMIFELLFNFTVPVYAQEEEKEPQPLWEITAIHNAALMTKNIMVNCNDTDELDSEIEGLKMMFLWATGITGDLQKYAELELEEFDDSGIDIQKPGDYTIIVRFKIGEGYAENFTISDEVRTLYIPVTVAAVDTITLSYDSMVRTYIQYNYRTSGDTRPDLWYAKVKRGDAPQDADWQMASDDFYNALPGAVRILRHNLDKECDYYFQMRSEALVSNIVIFEGESLSDPDDKGTGGDRDGNDHEDDTTDPPLVQPKPPAGGDKEDNPGGGGKPSKPVTPPTGGDKDDNTGGSPTKPETPPLGGGNVSSKPEAPPAGGDKDDNPSGGNTSDKPATPPSTEGNIPAKPVTPPSAGEDKEDNPGGGNTSVKPVSPPSAGEDKNGNTDGSDKNGSTGGAGNIGDAAGMVASSMKSLSGRVLVPADLKKLGAKRSDSVLDTSREAVFSEQGYERVDGETMTISGTRLDWLLEANPETVPFGWNDVSVELSSAFLRGLGLSSEDMLSLTLTREDELAFTIAISAKGEEIRSFDEAVVRLPAPEPENGYTLSLDGRMLDTSVTYEDGLAVFTVEESGSYALGGETVKETKASQVFGRPEAVPEKEYGQSLPKPGFADFLPVIIGSISALACGGWFLWRRYRW